MEVIKQELATDLNEILMEQLELCTSTEHLGDLKSCKTEWLPDMIERCNDNELSNMPVCSDIRLKEFSNTINGRIESANNEHLNRMVVLTSELDVLQTKQIEHCLSQEYDLDGCKNGLLEIKNGCMRESMKGLPSCNDPRVELFLEKQHVQPIQDLETTNSQPISEQILIDTTLQAMYARTVRDCIEGNHIFDSYMLTLLNLDSISYERKIAAYEGVETMNICSADVREIQSNYCYLFSSCTETGKFETFWEVIPKLQQSFDKVCANTGELCGYTFQQD